MTISNFFCISSLWCSLLISQQAAAQQGSGKGKGISRTVASMKGNLRQLSVLIRDSAQLADRLAKLGVDIEAAKDSLERMAPSENEAKKERKAREKAEEDIREFRVKIRRDQEEIRRLHWEVAVSLHDADPDMPKAPAKEPVAPPASAADMRQNKSRRIDSLKLVKEKEAFINNKLSWLAKNGSNRKGTKQSLEYLQERYNDTALIITAAELVDPHARNYLDKERLRLMGLGADSNRFTDVTPMQRYRDLLARLRALVSKPYDAAVVAQACADAKEMKRNKALRDLQKQMLAEAAENLSSYCRALAACREAFVNYDEEIASGLSEVTSKMLKALKEKPDVQKNSFLINEIDARLKGKFRKPAQPWYLINMRDCQ